MFFSGTREYEVVAAIKTEGKLLKEVWYFPTNYLHGEGAFLRT
jgi:hypothetical protein